MADIIDHIFDIWRRQSHLDYGESVTTIEHMLQCAVFAERDDAEDTLVAATVLHDIGHRLHGLHVPAKRCLCAVEPSYFDTLSPSSVQSLALQGGPLTDDDVAAFEQHDHWEDAVRLRRYDDMGKIPGIATPDLEHYRSHMMAGLRA
jgi:predicted HD phosphohydrolase